MRGAVQTACLLCLLSGAGAGSTKTRPAPIDLRQQAEAARSQGRTGEAIALYRRATAQQPDWAEGWWHLGTLLYDRDGYAEAAEAFGKAAALRPQVGNAFVMQGLSEFRAGRYDQALAHIRHGRKLGASSDAQFRRVMTFTEAQLLLHKGDFETAQNALLSLVRKDVTSQDLVEALGLSVLRMSPGALAASTRALVLEAGAAEYLAGQQRQQEATSAYERLASDHAREPNVQFAYGRYLLTVHEHEKAIAAFKREIDNDPKHLLARLAIAEVSQRIHAADGLRYAEEAVQMAPKLPLARYLLGLSLLDSGETERAIQELELARRAMPAQSRIYWALARAYARANRTEESLKASAEFKKWKALEDGKDAAPQ